MRWWTNYNNVLTLAVSRQGLYLGSMFLFRFMHPPMLVPWSEVKVQWSKGWVFEYVSEPEAFLKREGGRAGTVQKSVPLPPDCVSFSSG